MNIMCKVLVDREKHAASRNLCERQQHSETLCFGPLSCYSWSLFRTINWGIYIKLPSTCNSDTTSQWQRWLYVFFRTVLKIPEHISGSIMWLHFLAHLEKKLRNDNLIHSIHVLFFMACSHQIVGSCLLALTSDHLNSYWTSCHLLTQSSSSSQFIKNRSPAKFINLKSTSQIFLYLNHDFITIENC